MRTAIDPILLKLDKNIKTATTEETPSERRRKEKTEQAKMMLVREGKFSKEYFKGAMQVIVETSNPDLKYARYVDAAKVREIADSLMQD